MNTVSKAELKIEANVEVKPGISGDVKMSSHYVIECHDKNGILKWVEEIDNIVVTVGLNELLNQMFKGSSYTAAWYVGITATTPTFAAGNTMSSHAGWTEVVAYDEANRQTLTLGTPSSGSVSNTASKAQFTINATTTVGGAFVCNNNTKSGTTGILYGGAAFAADRSLVDDDVVSVTVTLTAATG